MDKHLGIKARDVQRARIVESAAEAHQLLARMEADGELAGMDSIPGTREYPTWTFTKARQ